MALGSILVRLSMNTADFETDTARAAKIADRRAKEIDKVFNNAGRRIGASLKSAAVGFAGLAGLGVGMAGVASSLKGAVDQADRLGEISNRIGVGAESLSEGSYAAKMSGTDIEELNRGLMRLSKSAAAALINPNSRQSSLFKSLGISRDELSDLDNLVPAIADKFSGMADGVAKVGLAQELLGRSGANLIEFLNRGSDGLGVFADKARSLGIVVSQDAADAAGEFNDRLDDLRLSVQGLALKALPALLPQMTSLLKDLTTWVSNGDNAAIVARDFADGMRGIASALSQVGAVAGPVWDALGRGRKLLAGLTGQLGAVGEGLVGEFERAEFFWKRGQTLINQAMGTQSDFSNVTGGSQTFKPDFSNVTGGLVQAPDLGADNPVISGGRGAATRRSELTEEQKAADELTKSYESLRDSMNERIALFGDETEVARLSYDLQSGSLKSLDEMRKQELLAGAQILDQKREEEELTRLLADADRKRMDAIGEKNARTSDALSDIAYETRLLGMSNVEREKANALRYAGVDAASAEGQSIVDAITRMDGMRQVQDLASSTTDAFSGLFDGIASGSLTAKDALKSFFKDVTQMTVQFLLQKVVSQFMTSFMGGSGGTAFSAAGYAKGGAWAGGVQFFEKGGAFTNGIYSQPTLFKFGRGGQFGVMGEAGPEAVLPLQRGNDGKLGVRASSGGSVSVNINQSFNTQGGGGSTKGQSDAFAMRISKETDAAARRVIIEEQRPGGLLWRMSQG